MQPRTKALPSATPAVPLETTIDRMPGPGRLGRYKYNLYNLYNYYSIYYVRTTLPSFSKLKVESRKAGG